jgi:hypothetical protein
VLNVESPERARDIDEQTIRGDVQSRTYPSSSAESKMIPAFDIGDGSILGRAEREVYEPVWVELQGQQPSDVWLLSPVRSSIRDRDAAPTC